VAIKVFLVAFPSKNHKVPRPYSDADEYASSLTGARDDDL